MNPAINNVQTQDVMTDPECVVKNDKSPRVKLAYIPMEGLGALLALLNMEEQWRQLPCIDGLPATAKVVSCYLVPQRRCLAVMFEDASFGALARGASVPIMQVTVREMRVKISTIIV